MRKLFNYFGLTSIALIASGVASCSDEPGSRKSRAIDLTQPEIEIACKTNEFGWKYMVAAMESKGDDNIIVSPFSASIDLCMAIGNKKETAKEEVLGLLGFSDADMDYVYSTNQKMIKGLPSLDKDITLGIANSYWTQDIKGKTSGSEYYSNLQKYFGVEYHELVPGTFVKDVNNWCASKSNNFLQDLYEEDMAIREEAYVNLLYYKGEWSDGFKFDKSLTKKDVFHSSRGEKQITYFMSQTVEMPYSDNQYMQVAALPMGKGNFSFVVILPANEVSPKDCIQYIIDNGWEVIKPKMSSKILYNIPKFDIHQPMENATDIFISMGFIETFTDGDGGAIYLGARFKIDEEGAEAAAVTDSGFTSSTGFIPGQMIMDKPFVYLITEESTGAILFLGVLNNV